MNDAGRKDRREKVFNSIAFHIARDGMPPSIRELCKEIGVKSSSTIYQDLKELEQEGRIKIDPQSARGIHITDAAILIKQHALILKSLCEKTSCEGCQMNNPWNCNFEKGQKPRSWEV